MTSEIDVLELALLIATVCSSNNAGTPVLFMNIAMRYNPSILHTALFVHNERHLYTI